MKFQSNVWAVIIGGSSGFGLATARKLAGHGMNLCIVHRDRRGAMRRITPAFDDLKALGVEVLTFNLDGLSEDGRTHVLDTLEKQLGKKGKVRLLLHTVAFGNLKLLVPGKNSGNATAAREKLSKNIGVSERQLNKSIQEAFEQGQDEFFTLVDPPVYEDGQCLEKDDFSRTIHGVQYC